MRNFIYVKIFLLITLPCLHFIMGYSGWTTDVEAKNPYVAQIVTRSVLSFTKSPAETYVCLYISPQLPPCSNSHSDDEKNFQPIITSSPILQRMRNRNTPHSLCVQGLEESQKQTFEKIQTVTLLGCKSDSVPFVLPCCTADDLFDERRIKTGVYAFVTPTFVAAAPYEFSEPSSLEKISTV